MRRTGAGLAVMMALAATACAEPAASPLEGPPPAACEIAQSDLDWLDRSLAAVREAAQRLSPDINLDRTEILVFDADCLLRFAPDRARSLAAHDGMIPLPIGSRPATIMSFAAPSPDPGSAYFVMALPSVWEAAGFSSELELHDFTLGVFAHEISHVWQLPTYYQSIRIAPGVERLPAPVDDDMVQRLFAADEPFRLAVEAEIRAFNEAAAETELNAMRALARHARERMKARWADHFTGDRAALTDVQAIFLTLEGSGQWFALEALSASPSGPGLDRELALRAFGQRGGKWSQDLGLALTAVLGRLDPDWPASVYGPGEQTLLDLLDTALAQP